MHSKSEKEPKLPYKSDKFRRLILGERTEFLKNWNFRDLVFCYTYVIIKIESKIKVILLSVKSCFFVILSVKVVFRR